MTKKELSYILYLIDRNTSTIDEGHSDTKRINKDGIEQLKEDIINFQAVVTTD